MYDGANGTDERQRGRLRRWLRLDRLAIKMAWAEACDLRLAKFVLNSLTCLP